MNDIATAARPVRSRAGSAELHMDQLRGARSLAERLDRVAALFGGQPAQTWIASGTVGETPRLSTYTELASSVRRRAAALAQLGVRRDEVIAALLPLSEVSYPSLLAAMVCATVAPVNYFLEADSLIALVRASGASVLLTAAAYEDDPQCLAKIARIRAALPQLRHVVCGADQDADGAASLERLAPQAPERWPAGCTEAASGRVAALFHTGGTTGAPKLVPHSEGMYLAAVDACARAQGTLPGEVMMAPLPLFHTSGALQAGLVPLLSGVHLVLPCARGFRAPELLRDYWRFVERHRVGIIAGVPTVLAALAATRPDADVRCVHRVLCGGAPLALHVIEALGRLLGPHELLEGWGMTETCGFSVLNPPGGAKAGSAGLPFPGVEIEVRRADAGGALNLRCACDEIGELVVRGDIVIRRYHDERPGAFTADGWLRTGDRARIDADGYLWITGRVKDLIIRSGHNIEPALIEEPAYQHPAVQLAAAVGRPDRKCGELPVLYVQLKSGAQASSADIADFVAARIQERAAIPKTVHILEQMPLSGPGKISKLSLRREAARACLQAEVDGALAGSPAGVRLEIVEDERHGQVAALRPGGPLPEAARLAVEAALRDYTIRHRWLEGSP